MVMKTCGNCLLFKPSPYNPESGNGTCMVNYDWLTKHKERGTHPSDAARKSLYKELGGRANDPSALLQPSRDSTKCRRFKPMLELVK